MADSDPTGRLCHPKFTCAHCARSFTRFPSVVKHDPPKFCCKDCKYASFRQDGWPVAKPQVNVLCATCGKMELVGPAQSKTRKFCSQECMIKWRNPLLSKLRYLPLAHQRIRCELCGSEFETHKCRIIDGRGRFCSRACVGAWTVRNKQNRVSKSETRFLDELEKLGINFIRQASIGTWTVDALFVNERIAIEYDGEYWHSLPKSIERDTRKNAELAKLGYLVIRIPERMHIDNPVAAVMSVFDEVSRFVKGC